MAHEYQSNYNENEYLDVVEEFLNGNLKCRITTYSKRGKAKVKTVSLWKSNLEGNFANYHRI